MILCESLTSYDWQWLTVNHFLITPGTRYVRHLHCMLGVFRKTLLRKNTMIIAKSFYAILFLITLLAIGNTLWQYPLFPLQTSDLSWSNAWLVTTVVDYYGSTLCLCGIILATHYRENAPLQGWTWSVGCCLLGSPVACLWMLYQVVHQSKSLALTENNGSGGESSRLLRDWFVEISPWERNLRADLMYQSVCGKPSLVRRYDWAYFAFVENSTSN